MIEYVGNSLILSVVIPVYNVEAYLDRGMKSVLAWTYRS